MVDKRRPPTALWDPLAHPDGPLPRWGGAPAQATLSVTALAVALDDTPDYVPAARLTDERRREAERVLVGLGTPPVGGFALLSESPAGADVTERALAALGPVARPEQFYLVRTGPGTDPDVALLPQLVHEFAWLGDDLGITHLGDLGGLAVFGFLSWAVPSGRGAVVLVVDQQVFVPGEHVPSTVSAVAVRFRRGDGPVRVRSWGDGAPPVGALARATASFGGPGPCDAWLALHAAVRTAAVRDGDRVLLRAGRDARSTWAELEITERRGLHLGGESDDDREH